ncbi:ASCH domain-containing protein [Deinococcota bacterium DY0809b]
MPRPKRGLIVREPYAGWIVDGVKTWEIRKHPTRVRGPIGIVSGGRLIGQVDVVGVEGPFGAEELAAHEDRHRAGGFLEAYAQGKPLWAWVLENPRRYPEPLPVPPRRGRMLWVNLDGVQWPGSDQTEP